jgi:hypothetical protein
MFLIAAYVLGFVTALAGVVLMAVCECSEVTR